MRGNLVYGTFALIVLILTLADGTREILEPKFLNNAHQAAKSRGAITYSVAASRDEALAVINVGHRLVAAEAERSARP